MWAVSFTISRSSSAPSRDLIVVDRLSRRAFLIGSFTATAASLGILSLCPQLPSWAMTILFAVFAGVLSAASNLVYVYLPELFPTDLRASGIGLAIACSRTGSAFSTFLLPIIVESWGVRSALNACVAVLGGGRDRVPSLGAGDAPRAAGGARSAGRVGLKVGRGHAPALHRAVVLPGGSGV